MAAPAVPVPFANQNTSTPTSSYTARAYASQSATSGLAPHAIQRRSLLPDDIQIDILYCGVCHTDLHWARNEWPDAFPTAYPCVPGHEILGRVINVGRSVTKF